MHVRQEIRRSDKLAGKRVKCPACAEPIQIPAGSGGAAPSDQAKPKALKVACACGKTLLVKTELAGKAVTCPSCGNAVRIGTPKKKAAPKPAAAVPPAGGGIDDLLDEVDLSVSATGHRCPECRHELEPDDVICVKCGYNLETGKKLQTRTSRKVDPIEKLKGVSAKDIKQKRKAGQSFDVSKQPWLIVAVVLIVPTAIMWFVNPLMAVMTLVMVSSLANLIGSIWILVIAFQDSVLQGVLCLFVPCYMLYYIISNWEETKAPTGIIVVSIVASVVGNAMAASVIPPA